MNVKMNFPIAQSFHFRSQGADVSLHAISTGMLKVKTSYRNSKWGSHTGLIASYLSNKFTEWMPIWVWVIEHPEGIFVLDTGEIESVGEEDYFKKCGRFEHWLNTTQFKFKITRQDEIDMQIKQFGIRATDVQKVYLSHLHLDHVEGLKHFPHCEIFVHDEEWAHPYGDLPELYPDWFAPLLIQLDEKYSSFKRAKPLTNARDLWMVHSPGHTSGHCSFILETDSVKLFFAGDVSYSQDQLIHYEYAAANQSRKQSADTYSNIIDYATVHKCIYLPSHEWACIDRLKNLETLSR